MKAYLVSKGIPENQITVSSISSQTLHGRTSDGGETSEITGYSLRQELSVRSTDVDKIGQIAREATELINQGILIESMAPEYFYTQLGGLKIEMLAEAAKDAKITSGADRSEHWQFDRQRTLGSHGRVADHSGGFN